MADPRSPASLAEASFDHYLAQWMAGAQPKVVEFLALHPPEVRAELERMLERLAELRGHLESSGSGLRAGQLLGDYRLVRELGRGGMGVVWEAEQRALRRRVALKVLGPEFQRSPKRVERFRREAEAGGCVSHPNLVAIYAVGEDQGTHYIVQELVAGGRTLSELLAEARGRGERPAGYYREQAARLAEIADALHALHEAGVIHRDVKPGNILVTPEGPWKLSDFGLAHLDQALALTQSQDQAGTPFYMSPEQVQHPGTVDRRSDVFSLGATCYELLTLSRPFQGDTSRQVMEQILKEEPLDPRRLRASVPAELAWICLKALDKAPARRYPTAAALADDLRRFLHHQPVLARPASLPVRAQKWLRRHPTAALAGGLTAGALVAVSVLALQLRASAAAARAEAASKRQVAAFLTDLFADGVPDHEAPARLSVEELLLRGAARLAAAEPKLDPLTRAELQAALGYAMTARSRLEAAEPLLVQSYAVRSALLGGRHPDTVRSQIILARLRSEQGRHGEAEELARAACLLDDAVLPASEPWPWVALRVRVHALAGLGRLAEALELSNEAVRRCTAALGTEHLQTAYCEFQAAKQWQLGGDRNEFLSRMRALLARCEPRYGPDHVFVLAATLALAEEELTGHLESSAARLAALLPRAEQTLGREHPLTLNVRAAAACAALYRGDPARAQRELAEVVSLMQAARPAHDSRLLTAQGYLAHSLCRLGRAGEAAAVLEPALAASRDGNGPEHPLSLMTQASLARADHEAGRPESAERGFSEVLEILERRQLRFPVVATMCVLGTSALLYQRGEYAAADAVFERGRRLELTSGTERLQITQLAACAKVELGQYEAGFALLQEQAQRRAELGNPAVPPLVDVATGKLIEGYARRGELARARAVAEAGLAWTSGHCQGEIRRWLDEHPAAPAQP